MAIGGNTQPRIATVTDNLQRLLENPTIPTIPTIPTTPHEHEQLHCLPSAPALMAVGARSDDVRARRNSGVPARQHVALKCRARTTPMAAYWPATRRAQLRPGTIKSRCAFLAARWAELPQELCLWGVHGRQTGRLVPSPWLVRYRTRTPANLPGASCVYRAVFLIDAWPRCAWISKRSVPLLARA